MGPSLALQLPRWAEKGLSKIKALRSNQVQNSRVEQREMPACGRRGEGKPRQMK